MKDVNSRRNFLRGSILAVAGVALVPKTIFANNLTNTSNEFGAVDFNKTADIRESKFFGKHLTVKGKIYDTNGTSPLSNATLDVWHLSPDSKNRKHKVTLKTNSFGEYVFKTDFPEKEDGKAPRIYFKASNGSKEYATELLISDFNAEITGKHWEKNKQLGKNLFPTKVGATNASTITFNISI